jgi:hypothetical protein
VWRVPDIDVAFENYSSLHISKSGAGEKPVKGKRKAKMIALTFYLQK